MVYVGQCWHEKGSLNCRVEKSHKRRRNLRHYLLLLLPRVYVTLCSENRSNFDITSTVFLKRLFSTLLFFKSDFLTIDEGKTELYGFLWLTLTYVIILGLASNLNEYFILPVNYTFSNLLLLKACGVSLIFLVPQPFLYSAVVKSLEGSIPTI